MAMGLFSKKTPSPEQISSLLAASGSETATTTPQNTSQKSQEFKPKRPNPREAVSATILQDQLNQLKLENSELKAHLLEKGKDKDVKESPPIVPSAALETAKSEVMALREKIKQMEHEHKQTLSEIENERQAHKKTIEKLKHDFTDIELNLRDEISRLRKSELEYSPESGSSMSQLTDEPDHSIVLQDSSQTREESEQAQDSAPSTPEATESLDINELLAELERNPPQDD